MTTWLSACRDGRKETTSGTRARLSLRTLTARAATRGSKATHRGTNRQRESWQGSGPRIALGRASRGVRSGPAFACCRRQGVAFGEPGRGSTVRLRRARRERWRLGSVRRGALRQQRHTGPGGSELQALRRERARGVGQPGLEMGPRWYRARRPGGGREWRQAARADAQQAGQRMRDRAGQARSAGVRSRSAGAVARRGPRSASPPLGA